MDSQDTEQQAMSSEQSESNVKLAQSTHTIVSEDLRWMMLERNQLPPDLAGFEMLNERELSNDVMAERGQRNRTADDLRGLGRIGGYLRQFAVPQGAPTLAEEPAEILEAATVAHLFEQPDQVRHWIDEVFVREFLERVGKEEGNGQRVLGVEPLDARGFSDYAAGLLVVHEIPGGVLASTIMDFQVGRLLGVAYVVSKRDQSYGDLTRDLGVRLEQQIVRVVLGAA